MPTPIHISMLYIWLRFTYCLKNRFKKIGRPYAPPKIIKVQELPQVGCHADALPPNEHFSCVKAQTAILTH